MVSWHNPALRGVSVLDPLLRERPESGIKMPRNSRKSSSEGSIGYQTPKSDELVDKTFLKYLT
jgi:hypothetical protein